MAFSSPFWSPSEASAVLFDWDGVIADTKLDFSSVSRKYFGDRPAMLLEDARTLSPELREALMRDLEELEVRGAENAALVPGVSKILEWVKSSGIPWAVVSRNCRKSILTAAGVIGVALPEIVRSRDDGERVKPDPAALREVCAALGADAGQTLLVGDYIYDMMGARRAGMRGVLVRNAIRDGWDDWLECHYKSMDEFYGALVNNEKITAWEYKDAFSRYGAEFLRKAREIILPVPERAHPNIIAWAAQAASLGVGGFSVGETAFTPEMWRRNPSLDAGLMGVTIEEFLRESLKTGFPFARVVSGDVSAARYAPPGDAGLLAEYLLSVVG